jgi:hypothetical protein
MQTGQSSLARDSHRTVVSPMEIYRSPPIFQSIDWTV